MIPASELFGWVNASCQRRSIYSSPTIARLVFPCIVFTKENIHCLLVYLAPRFPLSTLLSVQSLSYILIPLCSRPFQSRCSPCSGSPNPYPLFFCPLSLFSRLASGATLGPSCTARAGARGHCGRRPTVSVGNVQYRKAQSLSIALVKFASSLA